MFPCLYSPVWKFHDFFITQILLEIKFVDSGNAKSANFTHSEAPNFDFYAFLQFLKAGICQKLKFSAPNMTKTAFFELLDSPKLISCKF